MMMMMMMMMMFIPNDVVIPLCVFYKTHRANISKARL